MTRVLIGFVLGVGSALTVSAMAQRIVGRDGYLFGWTVTVDGRELCSDPFIWTATREIECD
jgi:hypothetical protein